MAVEIATDGLATFPEDELMPRQECVRDKSPLSVPTIFRISLSGGDFSPKFNGTKLAFADGSSSLWPRVRAGSSAMSAGRDRASPSDPFARRGHGSFAGRGTARRTREVRLVPTH